MKGILGRSWGASFSLTLSRTPDYAAPQPRFFPPPHSPQEEPVQPLVRAALRPSQGSQQRIRRHLRASAREIQQNGRYRVVSSRRSSGIPSGGLGSEDAPGSPEAAEDAGFQLLDLVHEEGDPEVAAISCKVSTRRESSSGLLGTESTQS